MSSVMQRLFGRGSKPQPSCFDCGYRDSQRQGWYDDRSGQLAPGFAIDASDLCVDVGCGGGGDSLFAARRGAEVIAVDSDPAVIGSLEAKLAGLPQRCRTVLSDSDPLPLADGIATRVIAMEVLEHVADPDRFVAELVRIGRPGSRYLISVPHDRAEAVQKRVAAPAYWQPPNHLRVFADGELESLLVGHGLSIERRLSKSFFWAMWWILFWAADQELGEPEGPLLRSWTRTWDELLKAPGADPVRHALDECMPKSRVLIASKPAAT